MQELTPLKRIIRDDGLRQEWLADRSQVSESDLSRMANRGMLPTPEQAQRIADVLGRDVADVFPAVMRSAA